MDAHDLPEHAEEVLAEDQADVTLAEAASEQRSGEVGEVSRGVQVLDVEAAVEAFATQIRVGGEEVVVDVGDEVWTDSDVLDADDLDQMLVVVDDTVDRRVLGVDEAGEQVEADHAARRCDAAQLFIGEIAMVIAERSRSRVRCDDRTSRELEDVLDTGRAEMRHVEDDAESLHLAEDGNACSRQSTTRLIFAAAVREQRPAHVGERDHPNAELVEDLEDAFVGSERKRALHRDDERDLPVVQGGVDLRAGPADRNIAAD